MLQSVNRLKKSRKIGLVDFKELKCTAIIVSFSLTIYNVLIGKR